MNTTAPHPYRASIPPLPAAAAAPRWSVMIPTYNCARFLPETLAAVLAQAPGPEQMQIMVVDDHSSDDPGAVVAQTGGRVAFFRQDRNRGHIANFASCLQLARGQLVHLLHGDDYVRPGFYAAMEAAFARHPEIGAAFCAQIFVDDTGRELSRSKPLQAHSGLLAQGVELLASEQRIMTPSIVVRRAVYEQLGGFDQRLVCSEDWEMWVRIAARYPIWYQAEPLAVYRMHRNSNTGRHIRSAEDIGYTRVAIDMFRPYLPPERAGQIVRRAKTTYAFSALHTAAGLARDGDLYGVVMQVREALRLRCSPATLRRASPILLRALWRRLAQARAGAHGSTA